MQVPWHWRASRYLEAHPWVTDTAVFALPLTILTLMFTPVFGPPLSLFLFVIQVFLLTVMCLSMAIRRTFPLLTAWIVTLCSLIFALLVAWPTFALATVPLTVYSVTAYARPPWGKFFLAVGIAGSFIFSASWFIYVVFAYQYFPIGIEIIIYGIFSTAFCASSVILAWTFGDIRNRKRRDQQQIAERNELLEREREHEIQLATDAERMRIARDMHDIVAHSMSVMIAQADGGRYAAATNPAAAVSALSTISDTGREALTNMRAMLGVLRAPDSAAIRSPMPGFDDLPDLISSVQATGLTVEFTREHHLPNLPAAAQLVVYRVIQEALTNVLKHGGPVARARVTVRSATGNVIAEVVSTGRVPTTSAPGVGIQGMRERASTHGGSLYAAPTERGFVVVLTLPTS